MDHLPGDMVGDAAADAMHAMHAHVCPAGVLLLLDVHGTAITSLEAAQHRQARSTSSSISTSSFAPWQEPQQQHLHDAAARSSSSSSRPANLQKNAVLTAPQQQQQRVHKRNEQRLLRGTPSSTMIPAAHPVVGAVSGSSQRSLQQSANSYQPPKFFLSNVKATVVNTYEWQISRQATAGGVTLTADGQQRQQMGE
jgi:hypothetical protein